MNKFESKPSIDQLIKANIENIKLRREQLLDTISSSNEETTTIEFEVLSDEFSTETQPKKLEASSAGSRETLLSKNVTPSNKKPALWSRIAIFYLISIYKRLMRDETSGKSCFGPIVIWTEVSRKLQQRCFIFTPEQCRTKWLLLKKLYQHIRNETQLQRFEFFEPIHEYYKDPTIEKLLKNVRKTAKLNKKEKRSKRNAICLENVDCKNDTAENLLQEDATEVKATDDWQRFHFENTSQSEHHSQDSLEATDEMKKEKFDATEVAVTLDETHAVTTVQVLESGQPSTFENDISVPMGTPNFLGEYRTIIADQEKRRDERHQEKLRIFREYNERLLAQQQEAIMIHKELMERLISSL